MFKELYKVFYLESQNIKLLKTSKIKKILFTILPAVFIFFVFYGILGDVLNSASDFSEAFPGLNIPTLILQVGMTLSLLFCLITSFTFIFTIFYYDKNLENYLVFPITQKIFIRAKFLVVLRQVIQTLAIIYLPFVFSYIYLTIGNPNIMGIITLIVYIPVISIFMMSVCGLILSILMYFVNKIKNKAVARAIVIGLFATIMVGAYLVYLYTTMSLSMSEPGSEAVVIGDIVNSISNNLLFKAMVYLPNLFVHLVNFELIDFIIGFIPLVLIVIVSFFVFERLFFKGALGFNEVGSIFSKRGTKIKASKQSSVLKLSVLKEKNDILKTGVYAFNTIFGTVFMTVIFIVMMVYVVFFAIPDEGIYVVRNGMTEHISLSVYSLIVIGYAAFMTISNVGCATAFSREAKNLDAIRTLPINPTTIFTGKIIFHALVTLVCEVVLVVFLTLLLGLNPLFILAAIPLLALVIFTTSYTSSLVDVMFPSLDWESEAIIIKKSRSALVGVLVSFLLIFIIFGTNALLLAKFMISVDITLIINIVFFSLLLALEIYLYNKLVNKKIKLY